MSTIFELFAQIVAFAMEVVIHAVLFCVRCLRAVFSRKHRAELAGRWHSSRREKFEIVIEFAGGGLMVAAALWIVTVVILWQTQSPRGKEREGSGGAITRIVEAGKDSALIDAAAEKVRERLARKRAEKGQEEEAE